MSQNEHANEFPSKVCGILLDGSEVTAIRGIPITPPTGQENHSVPVMLHSGIPLYARKVPLRTKKDNNFAICRVMSDPDIGLSQGLWQDFTSYPSPTFLFRTDGVPFTPVDYSLFDDFEMKMLNEGPRQVTPGDWISFAASRRSGKIASDYKPPKSYLLDKRYTNPLKQAPLITDDVVRLLYLGGDSFHLRTPESRMPKHKAHGVYVHGEKIAPKEMPLSVPSTPVTIAKMAGLSVRAHILRESDRESRSLFRMTRLMRHPLTGSLPTQTLPKSWEEPSMAQGFWPVHVFRSDGIPFTVFDFFVIDQFYIWARPTRPGIIYENLWKAWIKAYIRRHDEENVSIAASVLLTEAKFPAGTRVLVKNLLLRRDLNGQVGFVASEPSRKVGRIAVEFCHLRGAFAVKLDNVSISE